MKIARNVAVSERFDEWHPPRPGSLSEGAGMELYHSPGYSLKSDVTGDFHRPYATQKFFTFYHSSGDTPSEREPGNVPPITSITRPLDVSSAGG